MIKQIIFIIMAISMTIVANATNVTFDFANNEFKLPTTSNTSDATKFLTEPINKDGIIFSMQKGTSSNGPLMYFSEYNKSIDLRFYKGSSFEITSSTGEAIISIAFNCNNGKLDISTANGEWTGETFSNWIGSESHVLFEVNGSTQIKSIIITTEAGSISCAPPTFSPQAGEYYQETQVSISCATTDAKIHYTTDGSTPTILSELYETPISISKETTIKAIGINGTVISDIAEAKYTFPEFVPVNNISEYLKLENTALPIRFCNNLTVTYQNAKYLFVKDNTGELQIFGAINQFYNKGDIIPQGIVGNINNYGGTPQLTPIASSFQKSSQTTTVEPKDITIADLNNTLANYYVMGRNWKLTIQKNGNTFNYSLADHFGTTLPIYMRFKGISAPTNEGYYDVEGIVNLFNGQIQLFPISFTTSLGINDPEASSTKVIGGNGQIIISCQSPINIKIISISGQLLLDKKIAEGKYNFVTPKGLYFIKTGTMAQRVFVK